MDAYINTYINMHKHTHTHTPVANEDGALYRANEDPAILAVVHLYLGSVITNVDVAIFTIFDNESLSVDASRWLDAHLLVNKNMFLLIMRGNLCKSQPMCMHCHTRNRWAVYNRRFGQIIFVSHTGQKTCAPNGNTQQTCPVNFENM